MRKQAHCAFRRMYHIVWIPGYRFNFAGKEKTIMRKNRAFTALLFCAMLVSSGFAQTAKVLINHVGYDPAGPKRASH